MVFFLLLSASLGKPLNKLPLYDRHQRRRYLALFRTGAMREGKYVRSISLPRWLVSLSPPPPPPPSSFSLARASGYDTVATMKNIGMTKAQTQSM